MGAPGIHDGYRALANEIRQTA